MLNVAKTVLVVLVLIQAPAQRPQEVFDQAVTDFEQGRVVQSAAGFDTLAKMVPDSAPQLWQRGIALYYAGRSKTAARNSNRIARSIPPMSKTPRGTFFVSRVRSRLKMRP